MHEQNSGPCGKGCHGSSVAPIGIVTASWLGIAKNNNTQGTTTEEALGTGIRCWPHLRKGRHESP